MNQQKETIVIYHKADYDGIFCREIARKFFGDNAEYIGWDYGDPVPVIQSSVVEIYMLDISIAELMNDTRLIWIDHHKSAIEKFPSTIRGYRIDGVAACRLTWQYLIEFPELNDYEMPDKDDFIKRMVSEPLAVRLAGEYDIWDHRGDGDLEFQFGLDCLDSSKVTTMLDCDETTEHAITLGKAAMACYAKRDADVMRERSFMFKWEGLNFLVLNTARCNSNTFNSKDKPETGHDALMAFYFNGKCWTFSLYHAAHRKDIDLSLIAVKHGGGGHRGACGFRLNTLPF